MEIQNRGTNGFSVLIVDDDQAITGLIRHNLEDTTVGIFEAAGGLECLNILLEKEIDLIILDLRLPDFSGWGILSLLRLTEQFRHMPVIVNSVEPPDANLIKLLKPAQYIQKPFDICTLLACIEKYYRAKRYQFSTHEKSLLR